MIDIRQEKLIKLSEAAKLVPPRLGKKRHVSSVWRWAKYGHNGVRLEALRTPDKTWYTTAEAVARFMTRLAADGLAEKEETSLDIVKENMEAEASLKAMGFEVG